MAHCGLGVSRRRAKVSGSSDLSVGDGAGRGVAGMVESWRKATPSDKNPTGVGVSPTRSTKHGALS